MLYPHHPQAGCEVGVLAHRRSSGTLHVLLPDETTATLPEWMFDAAYCQALVRQETPVLSVDALRDLRQLVDSVCFPGDANSSTKNPRGETTQAPNRTGVDQRTGEPSAAGGDARGMSPTARPDAAASPGVGKGGSR